MESSERTPNDWRIRCRVIYAILGGFAFLLVVSQKAASATELIVSIAVFGYALMLLIFMLPVVVLLLMSPRDNRRYGDMLFSSEMFFISAWLYLLLPLLIDTLIASWSHIPAASTMLLLMFVVLITAPFLSFLPEGKRRYGSYRAMLAKCTMLSIRYVVYCMVFQLIVLFAMWAMQLPTQQGDSFLVTLLRLCVCGFPYAVIFSEIALFYHMFKDISTRGETMA